jgi:hypothetical protein
MIPLKIGSKFVDCVGCKLNTHPSFKCPFPEVPGWKGPQLEPEDRFNQRMAALAEKAKKVDATKKNKRNDGGQGGGPKQGRTGGGFVKTTNGKHK